MQILTPSISHIVFYIRRYNLDISYVIFTDESTNTTTDSISVTETELEWYSQVEIEIVDPLVSDRFYMMAFYDATDKLLHLDKVFVTNQPIPTFTVNNGVYDYAPSTDNDYIIYNE